MKKVTILTKGLAKGDLGPAAIGVIIVDDKGKVLKKLSEGIGNATNDYAEYFAVVRGLQETAELFGDKTHKIDFELRVENEMVRNHMCAEEQIKDVSLIGHFIEIYNTRVGSFPYLDITLIKEGENQDVTALVKESLDL